MIIKEGYNSMVIIDDEKTIKIIGIKTKGFSMEDANVLVKRIKKYRELLLQHGVPAGEVGSIEIIKIKCWENYAIVITMRPYQQDLQDILQQAEDFDEIESHIKKTLEILNGFLKTANGKVGIDSKVANFMTSDGKEIDKFVDFFPPRFASGGIPTVEWPEPKTKEGKQLGLWKHYTPEGIFAVFLLQAGRIKPQWTSKIKKIILENTTFDNKSFLSKKCHTREQIKKLSNAYEMRLAALEIAEEKKIPQAEVNKFFNATHFEDTFSKQTMEKAKRIILSCIQNKFTE